MQQEINNIHSRIDKLERSHDILAADFKNHEADAHKVITEFREHKVASDSENRHISGVFSSFIQSIHHDVNSVSTAMHQITDEIKELIKKQDSRIAAIEDAKMENDKAIQKNTDKLDWHWRSIVGLGMLVVFILVTGLAMHRDIAVNQTNIVETKKSVDDIHGLLFPKATEVGK